MKTVRITVEKIVEVPDDMNVTALAMTLQYSQAVLFEQLSSGGYEVIIYTLKPPREVKP
jgi:hypothetical protein